MLKSIIRNISVVAGTIILFSSFGGDDKVTICHKPATGGCRQTITISVNALQAHIDHGDFVGTCDGGIPPKDDGGNGGKGGGNTGGGGSDMIGDF